MIKITTIVLSLFGLLLSPSLGVSAPSGCIIYWGYASESAPWPSIGVVTISDQVVSNVVAIAAGLTHSLALRSDGTVIEWGSGAESTVGDVKALYPDRLNGVVELDGQVLSNVVSITAAWTYNEAIKNDGTLVSWGREIGGGKLEVPGPLSNVVSVAAGWNHRVALKSNGTVFGWPENREPAGLSNIIAVATFPGGFGDILALKSDGTISMWTVRGQSVVQKIKNVTNAVAIAAGGWQNLALKENGTVVSFGQEAPIPSGLTNIVAIAAGKRHCLALRSDGTVVTWGANPRHALDVPAGLRSVVLSITHKYLVEGEDLLRIRCTNLDSCGG